jgi:hypothetical protein
MVAGIAAEVEGAEVIRLAAEVVAAIRVAAEVVAIPAVGEAEVTVEVQLGVVTARKPHFSQCAINGAPTEDVSKLL